MAARRGKSQAKRNQSNTNPAWMWLLGGLVLGVVLIVAVPKLLTKGDGDGFFRPKPNPDAEPVATTSAEEDDAIVPEDAPSPAKGDKAKPTTYDFYTLLPANEIAISDDELAGAERAEAARDAAEPAVAEPAVATPVNTVATTQTTPPVATNTNATATATTTATPKPAVAEPKDDGAHYILQAGAFQASGDAEAVKAKIAMLGLTARVESAKIADKTVFRVRMGPYGSASELADAKRRLGSGGLPAMAIKSR